MTIFNEGNWSSQNKFANNPQSRGMKKIPDCQYDTISYIVRILLQDLKKSSRKIISKK